MTVAEHVGQSGGPHHPGTAGLCWAKGAVLAARAVLGRKDLYGGSHGMETANSFALLGMHEQVVCPLGQGTYGSPGAGLTVSMTQTLTDRLPVDRSHAAGAEILGIPLEGERGRRHAQAGRFATLRYRSVTQ